MYAAAAEAGLLGEALISSDSCLDGVEVFFSPMTSTVDVFIAYSCIALPIELTN